MTTSKQQTPAHTTAPPEPKTEEKNVVEFIPFGAKDKIRLSAAMVRQFIAVPTRSGQLPSERDCIKFIMLCLGKRANPFEGDCYLIGYDTQHGPSYSMVCGIELFEKRAEQSKEYNGCESGVIVERNGEIVERQGALVFTGEKLIGGWAKTYRKDREHPEYKTVAFTTYNTGRSRWEKDPGGMIAKVAKSQALRAAFPTALGGLYTQEEMQRVTELGEDVAATRPAIPLPPPATTTKVIGAQGATAREPQTPTQPVGERAGGTPQPVVDELDDEQRSIMAAIEASHPDDLLSVKSEVGADAMTLEGIMALPDEDRQFAVTRLSALRAKRDEAAAGRSQKKSR